MELGGIVYNVGNVLCDSTYKTYSTSVWLHWTGCWRRIPRWKSVRTWDVSLVATASQAHSRYFVFNMRHIIAVGHYASQAHSRYFVPHRQHTAGSLCFTWLVSLVFAGFQLAILQCSVGRWGDCVDADERSWWTDRWDTLMTNLSYSLVLSCVCVSK